MPEIPSNGYIVVIGGSSGSLEVLKRLVSALPADFPAPIFVTVHIPSDVPSILPQILSSKGALPAVHPGEQQEDYRPGVIYVARPDYHLRVDNGQISLSRGPRENRHRPSIDVLFRTAARARGPGVIALVLSGELDDGSAGLLAVKMRGGIGIVQDPGEALSPAMPCNAIQYAGPDYVLAAADIPKLLIDLTRGPHAVEGNLTNTRQEKKTADEMEDRIEKPSKTGWGKPSEFACPECHGVLWEEEEGPGQLLQFRCRVGHAYTADALGVAMYEAGEDALWAAMRALEEKAALLRRMASRYGQRLASQYIEQASDYDKHAHEIRRILSALPPSEQNRENDVRN